jgi:4,5-DOPA dioxygenase extradiol
MQRRTFLQICGGLPLAFDAMDLQQLDNLAGTLPDGPKMPILFIGHGSPMNAILDNPFTRALTRMGSEIVERPNAVLVVSAHWLTRGGTAVAVTPKPETIYDFGGFPDELYRVVYPAPGAPAYAEEVRALVPEVQPDGRWGLDHGAWTVLKHLFPKADIPVFQLSIDYGRPMAYHLELARRLKKIREKGVLVIGSGNVVHNLRLWFTRPENMPYDWAIEFDAWVKARVEARDVRSLVEYDRQGEMAKLSVPTPDHYIPLLYSLGMADENEPIVQTYEEVLSAGSMRSFRIG